MDHHQMFLKQLNQVNKQEAIILNQKENIFVKEKMKPALASLQDKIPNQLKSGLESAFYKGFQLVFEKGHLYLEKTYNKEKIEIEYDLNNYAIHKHSSKRHLKKLDKSSNQANILNQSIAALEGGVLGLLGIGLFDIPIFISVMLRTMNEVALTYGYQYDTEEEKTYMLFLICATMSKEEEQRKYFETVDLIGKQIDASIVLDYDLETVMQKTASLLSKTLITTKFIQGFPIVGIIGGAMNPAIIGKLGKYAKLKYKKRYLKKKLNEPI